MFEQTERKKKRFKKLHFEVGHAYGAQDPATIALRKAINDEFGGGAEGWPLQCTEYVQYRVKEKLGTDIAWPVRAGRDGGHWWELFQAAGMYEILERPAVGFALCFTAGVSDDPTVAAEGHVAFVERVHRDGSIDISEANWPRDGIYNERTLAEATWRDSYRAKFVRFTKPGV